MTWISNWPRMNPTCTSGPHRFSPPYNWEGDRRLEHMDGQGIAAEIVFPNALTPLY